MSGPVFFSYILVGLCVYTYLSLIVGVIKEWFE